VQGNEKKKKKKGYGVDRLRHHQGEGEKRRRLRKFKEINCKSGLERVTGGERKKSQNGRQITGWAPANFTCTLEKLVKGLQKRVALLTAMEGLKTE